MVFKRLRRFDRSAPKDDDLNEEGDAPSRPDVWIEAGPKDNELARYYHPERDEYVMVYDEPCITTLLGILRDGTETATEHTSDTHAQQAAIGWMQEHQ